MHFLHLANLLHLEETFYILSTSPAELLRQALRQQTFYILSTPPINKPGLTPTLSATPADFLHSFNEPGLAPTSSATPADFLHTVLSTPLSNEPGLALTLSTHQQTFYFLSTPLSNEPGLAPTPRATPADFLHSFNAQTFYILSTPLRNEPGLAPTESTPTIKQTYKSPHKSSHNRVRQHQLLRKS